MELHKAPTAETTTLESSESSESAPVAPVVTKTTRSGKTVARHREGIGADRQPHPADGHPPTHPPRRHRGQAQRPGPG